MAEPSLFDNSDREEDDAEEKKDVRACDSTSSTPDGKHDPHACLTAFLSRAQYVELKQYTVWLIDARAPMLVEAQATDQVRC